MKLFALSCLMLLGLCQTSQAALIVELTQLTPNGIITLGNDAVFELTIHTDTGSINNLAGIDFVVNAADPGQTATETIGGQFSAGTDDFFAGGNDPYPIPFPTSTVIFGTNVGGGKEVTTTPTRLATLTLSTTGATPGTYLMGLSGLTAVDSGFGSLPISGTPSISYTIAPAAVPEPCTMLLMGVTATGFVIGRRRRCHK